MLENPEKCSFRKVVVERDNGSVGPLLDLGLTFGNARAEIMALSVTDYCEGPENDRDTPFPGGRFVFLIEVQ